MRFSACRIFSRFVEAVHEAPLSSIIWCRQQPKSAHQPTEKDLSSDNAWNIIFVQALHSRSHKSFLFAVSFPVKNEDYLHSNKYYSINWTSFTSTARCVFYDKPINSFNTNICHLRCTVCRWKNSLQPEYTKLAKVIRWKQYHIGRVSDGAGRWLWYLIQKSKTLFWVLKYSYDCLQLQ